MPRSPKLTPSRKQYLDLKAQHPDDILLMRMGDFYECFDEDARTVARELDIVLTSRPNGPQERIPMAGVPHHAAESYIARLINKGHKVALCEQMGDAPVNGLMAREVVRVFTAGTVIEPGMLDAGRNNYLTAVVIGPERAGLAYADITTGTFATCQLADRRAVLEELARLEPAELLLMDGEIALQNEWPPHRTSLTYLPAWQFDPSQARATLENHFRVRDLTSFGCEQKPQAIRAAGALLHYLQETQKGQIHQIQRLATYEATGYMALNLATRRNLELTESLSGDRHASLFGVLNECVTPQGTRHLRRRVTEPLLDVPSLEARLDQVAELVADALLRAELRQLLKGLPDLERLTNRVLSGSASPREVGQIGAVLAMIPALQALPVGTAVGQIIAQLNPHQATAALIQSAVVDDPPPNTAVSGFIRPGFSVELDGVVNASAHARQWVADLEPRERTRTGINSLKVGFNKVFGYYLEVTHANTKAVPDDFIRKQTLTNAERYITPELKEYETLILNAEERMLAIERRLFTELLQEVGRAAKQLLTTAVALAELDVTASLAEVAAHHNYTRPALTYQNILDIKQGRHPVIERLQTETRFVPNDTYFDEKERIHLITGPNMAGKSTILRQVALIVLLAQIGSFVPAESATIGLVDRIFTRIGAHDELHAGRSTFMVEMVEAAEILNHATNRSLLILDELGRGTSTYDGLSIAWAVAEYLHNHPRLRPRTLFATHYHELTGLTDIYGMVVNYNVAAVKEGPAGEDKLIFLHQLRRGAADDSFGIQVAQLAGLPRDVIRRAHEVLATLEANAARTTTQPTHLKPAQQAALFPETSPILQELASLDVASMTPLEAIHKLFEWQKKYGS